MTAQWELRLYDQAGARVATFDQWPEFEVTLGVNRPAAYALRLAGDDPRVALFEQDGILEGWYKDTEQGIVWHREFAAWTINRRYWQDQAGAEHFQSSGCGLEDLLGRTIVDTYSGSALSRASGAGEEAIKEFVEDQLGPTAGARARPGLTVEATHGPALGLYWSGQRSNKNLLTLCQQIAETTGLQFGIERTGVYTFEFQAWEPTDRTATVLFAMERGNMAEPELDIRSSEVRNWVKVGGDDAGALRTFAYRQDATSIAASPQNRREAFVNAVDQDPGDDLDAKGDEELSKNAATTEFKFVVLQAPGSLYAKHYFLGDYVRAIYAGLEFVRRVDSVTWTVNGQGTFIKVGTVGVGSEYGS